MKTQYSGIRGARARSGWSDASNARRLKLESNFHKARSLQGVASTPRAQTGCFNPACPHYAHCC